MKQHVKYPRTYHVPWSPGTQSDDRFLPSVKQFEGKEVVVTEKLDGENTTMYNDGLHARSIDGLHHPTRNYVKRIHGEISWKIPENMRVCGENMYAKHSIHYLKLTSYFYVFAIFIGNECLSWDDTEYEASRLELPIAPVLYRGLWDENKVSECYTGESKFGAEQEGWVVRVADSFHFDQFAENTGKWVRKGHVQTSEHWTRQQIVPNELA
jgi:hypothetical protein